MHDTYAKGQPHMVVTSIAGHFVGVLPVPAHEPQKPDKVWYRGDDFLALKSDLSAMVGERNTALHELELLHAKVDTLERLVAEALAEVNAMRAAVDNAPHP